MPHNDSEILLNQFNQREREAFGGVYTHYFKVLYGYTDSLFAGTTIDPDDVIHDIFLSIWENNKLKFNSLNSLKGYLFVSIRNRYLMFRRHRKFADHIEQEIIRDKKQFILQAAEAEIISVVPQLLEMLPEECARTLKLFLEGNDAKEIADQLGKKTSTVYNQRQTAISILRQKLRKKELLVLVLSIRNFTF